MNSNFVDDLRSLKFVRQFHRNRVLRFLKGRQFRDIEGTTDLQRSKAIIEAINAKKEIDKVFVQKDAQGDLMQDLMKTMKRNNINFSYVPVEKLNRLTPNNHQGAVATIAPISFVALETMVESVIESGKKPLFLILDQLSDATPHLALS